MASEQSLCNTNDMSILECRQLHTNNRVVNFNYKKSKLQCAVETHSTFTTVLNPLHMSCAVPRRNLELHFRSKTGVRSQGGGG